MFAADTRGRVRWPNQITAQLRADGANYTSRVFRDCCGHSEMMTLVRATCAQSQELMAEADAILGKGGKVLIEEYYRRT
jgi:hypothetical protein